MNFKKTIQYVKFPFIGQPRINPIHARTLQTNELAKEHVVELENAMQYVADIFSNLPVLIGGGLAIALNLRQYDGKKAISLLPKESDRQYLSGFTRMNRAIHLVYGLNEQCQITSAATNRNYQLTSRSWMMKISETEKLERYPYRPSQEDIDKGKNLRLVKTTKENHILPFSTNILDYLDIFPFKLQDSEGRIVREESDGQFKEIVRGTTINKDEVYILSLDDGLLLPYKFFQRKTIPPLREGGAPINFVGPEYLYFIKHRHKKKDDKKTDFDLSLLEKMLKEEELWNGVIQHMNPQGKT